MMQKQMEYNTEMWNKQNEYNTASAQRKRLEDAGLNPYLMMNGGSPGVAQSANNVSAASASSPIAMQSPENSLQALGMQISSLANPIKEFAQIKQMNAEAEIASVKSGIIDEMLNAELGIKQRENKMFDATFEEKVTQAGLQTKIMDNTVTSLMYDNMRKQIELAWLPEQYKYMAAEYQASIALKLAQGELTRNQAKHELRKIALTVARIANVQSQTKINQIYYSLQDVTFQYQLENAIYNSESGYWNSRSSQVAYKLGKVDLDIRGKDRDFYERDKRHGYASRYLSPLIEGLGLGLGLYGSRGKGLFRGSGAGVYPSVSVRPYTYTY